MKKYISILMVFAVALLFIGQSDALAKTSKQATEELSKDRDGETFYQAQAPKNYQSKSNTAEDKAAAPRLGRWFVTEIDALQHRVSRFWDQVFPMIYKNYKNIAVVD